MTRNHACEAFATTTDVYASPLACGLTPGPTTRSCLPSSTRPATCSPSCPGSHVGSLPQHPVASVPRGLVLAGVLAGRQRPPGERGAPLRVPHHPAVGPKLEVIQVAIDGVVINPSQYKLVDGTDLVRLSGEWPTSNDLRLADGAPGTFTITIQVGEAPMSWPARRASSWSPNSPRTSCPTATRTCRPAPAPRTCRASASSSRTVQRPSVRTPRRCRGSCGSWRSTPTAAASHRRWRARSWAKAGGSTRVPGRPAREAFRPARPPHAAARLVRRHEAQPDEADTRFVDRLHRGRQGASAPPVDGPLRGTDPELPSRGRSTSTTASCAARAARARSTTACTCAPRATTTSTLTRSKR